MPTIFLLVPTPTFREESQNLGVLSEEIKTRLPPSLPEFDRGEIGNASLGTITYPEDFPLSWVGYVGF